jgi:hypothetical protein
MERPPCWPLERPCPNACAAAHYQRTIHNETPLHGPWAGWRLAGRDLVSPHGDRIPAHLLDRLLWREKRFSG